MVVLTSVVKLWVLMTTTLAFALVPFPDGGLHKCAGAPFVHWRPSLLPHPSNRIILGRLGCSVRVSKTTSVMQQTSHKFLVTANLTRSVFSAMSSGLSCAGLLGGGRPTDDG